jgi:hypothetical protein
MAVVDKAREEAREELEKDITIPDYTELVEATVGQRMIIAAETIMAHLSTCIFLSHARLKAEQCLVGGSSPSWLVKDVDDYVRGVKDQIEMIQYIRGRIGEDRSTIFDMGRWAAYLTMAQDSRRHWQGKRRPQACQDARPSQARMTSPWDQRGSNRQGTRPSRARMTNQR